jgi:hypothetical protein
MTFMLAKAGEIARSPGDPKVIETGPSSRQLPDQAVRGLGWFSMALGATELLAAPALARWLGVEGRENLIRAYGAREVMAGVLCLSVDNGPGAWGRVAGDLLDIASLAAAYGGDNPKKGNVGLALAAVIGVTIADMATAQGLEKRHQRKGPIRDYSDRSGFPKGVAAARGAAARDVPSDMRAAPIASTAAPVSGETSPATEQLKPALQPAS